MVKILHATDVHTDLKKYEKLVNYANSSDVDAFLITGDLTDKDSKAYSIMSSKAVINAIKKNTANENLESIIKRLKTGEAILKDHPAKERILSEALNEFRAYQLAEIKAVYNILGNCKKQVYAVTGNHDPDFISEEMDNIHFLDKDGSAEICGIKFAGTPSTYELPAGVLPMDYTHLRDYVFDDAEDVAYSPEYNRLRNEKIDVLATHGGLADRLTRDILSGKRPDHVMYKLIKEKEDERILDQERGHLVQE